MQTIQVDLRREFPVKENKVYFNNASYTPMSASATSAITNALISYTTNGPSDDFYVQFKQEGGDSARQRLGSLLNVPAESLVFTESATQSINLVANGLKLGKGEVIITRGGASEHPSNYLPWWYYAKSKNAQILNIEVDSFGVPALSDLDSALKKTKAKLVVMSHVLYNHGSILPAREISKISHEREALFFLDVSQSVGSVPVDLDSIDPDFAAGTAAKWLCGPLGLAFFYCNKRALEELEPLNYGPNSCTYKPDGSYQTLDTSWKLQEGFRNWAYCYGLAAAIDLINKIGIESIRKKDFALASRLIESIRHSSTFGFVGNSDSNVRTSITPVEVRGLKALDVVQKLASEGIVIAEREVGDKKILRISPHFYNDENETNRVSEALLKFST